MYIGTLDYNKSLTFTHASSDVAFHPTKTENNFYTWAGEIIFDMGVDITLTLERESYVGAVTFHVGEASITAALVVVDGRVVGKHTVGGEAFGGNISVPVGIAASTLTVRLFANLTDLTVGDIAILGAYDNGVPVVWPTPKSIGECQGYANVKEVVAASNDADEIFAAQFLTERLAEKLGENKSQAGVTVVMKKEPSYKRDRYTVTSIGQTVTVSAPSRIALLFGSDTILSLTDSKGLYLCNIDDSPQNTLRGFHFGLPHKDKIEFTRLLLQHVLIPMRYNVIFLEFAGGMRFDRHPEISEGWLDAIEKASKGKQPYMPHSDKVSCRSLLEKEDVRRLVGYIKELGFALIPEIQSLSHVQYITYAHPEIAERDENAPKNEVVSGESNPSDFYDHCYCPSHPKSYEIIYDIIDEIVEVTNTTEYVHMGHDEVYQLGVCPRCKDKSRSTLLADHIIAMHDYLAKKGLKMMMWCDMLHPRRQADGEIERIPRDIVMLDFVWYFKPEHDIEDDILKHGFKTLIGNLYSSHFTRFNSRITKEGMVGGELSTWIITDEEIYGKNGKLWEMMYLSEMLWNTNRYNEANRKTYNKILTAHIQPRLRNALRATHSPSGYQTTPLEIIGSGNSLPRELLELCPRAVRADDVSIAVGSTYDRLVFEHATLNTAERIVWKPHRAVGEYTVEYEDGTRSTVGVRYAENVMCYKSSYGVPKRGGYYRHFGYVGTWFSDPVLEGKNEQGEDMTILGYVWENPNPEKKITRITYTSAEHDFCRLVLAGVKGQKRI